MESNPGHVFYNFAPIGYLLLDLRGIVMDINVAGCESLGRVPNNIIGKPFRLLVAEEGFSFPDFLERNARDGYVEKAALELRRVDGSVIETVVNVRIGEDSVLLIFDDVTEKNRLARERERLIGELREALDRIRTLTGILPICANCKKIRTDRGEWQQVEVYVSERTHAEFTHGICPECVEEFYPEIK
jgi:PAS domain S-box-containing protein